MRRAARRGRLWVLTVLLLLLLLAPPGAAVGDNVDASSAEEAQEAANAHPPASASQSSAHLSLKVEGGSDEGGFRGFDPCMTWRTSSTAPGGLESETSVDIALRSDTNIFSLPRALHSRIRRSLGGRWGLGRLSARADVFDMDLGAGQLGSVNVDMCVTSGDEDASFRILGRADHDQFLIKRIDLWKRYQARKPLQLGSLSIPLDRVYVNPWYDDRLRFLLCYESNNTRATLVASADGSERTISFSRFLGDAGRHRVAPTLSLNSGAVSLEYERYLPNGSGSVVTTVAPNDSIDVEWVDGPWTAKIHAPIEGLHGLHMDDMRVSIKRNSLLS